MAFAQDMWQLPDEAAHIYCKLCTRSNIKPGMWTCFGYNCKRQLAKEEFMLAREKHNEVTKTERDRKAREIIRTCGLKNNVEIINKLS